MNSCVGAGTGHFRVGLRELLSCVIPEPSIIIFIIIRYRFRVFRKVEIIIPGGFSWYLDGLSFLRYVYHVGQDGVSLGY